MHVQTVYEIPRHTFPIELLFDIAFIIVAIGLISQAISSFRRQKLNIPSSLLIKGKMGSINSFECSSITSSSKFNAGEIKL